MKTILVDAVHTLIIPGGEVFEEMHQLLGSYLHRKIILTNADDALLEKHKLHDAPYEVFTLKRNPEKSDPAYYHAMLKHYGFKPDEVVYFEHDLRAVASAREAGINTYHYDPEKKDLTALKQFLDSSL